MKTFITMTAAALCLLIAGCTTHKPTSFGPDPYNIECIKGEVWIGSENEKSKLGSKCEEGK